MRGRKSLLSVTGALEAATGLMLLVAPSVLVELLLGAAPGTALSSMDAPCMASCDNEAERTLGLQSSIRPCGAVGDRWPWWNPRIDAAITLSSLLLGQCLGFGRSRLPCFAITSSSPSQSRWQRLPAQPAAAIWGR